MERKRKLPQTALQLYVKLYCKKKDRINSKYYNNLVEATKSWVSLSQEEKQHFLDKYKEYRLNYKETFASYLKSAVPYLKKKEGKRISDSKVTEKRRHSKSNEAELPSQNEFQENVSHNQSTEKDLGRNSQREVSLAICDPQEYVLSEPAPPKLMSGQELFEMVKGTDEENDLTWKLLSNLEKSRYRNAVLKLKKEYINNYKAYLENLPSNELFVYYNKVN